MIKQSNCFKKHEQACANLAKATHGLYLITDTKCPAAKAVKNTYIRLLRRRTGLSAGQASWCWWNLFVVRDHLAATKFIEFMEIEYED